MQKRPSSSRRHLRFILALAFAFLGLGGVAWSQGYISFDIHGTGTGCTSATADCQAFQGSIYIPTSSPTAGTYQFGLGPGSNASGYYLVTNSGFTDMISSTSTPYCCSATESAAVNLGLGGANNVSAKTYAGTVTYEANKGWFVSSIWIGFQNSGGTYWIEGATSGPTAAGSYDVHAATPNGDGTYASPTANTNDRLFAAGLKTECMTPGEVGDPYCNTLASQPIFNPEINAGGLPKVILLLGSLYVLLRFPRSSCTGGSRALGPAGKFTAMIGRL
jgi:hypothetical protein